MAKPGVLIRSVQDETGTPLATLHCTRPIDLRTNTVDLDGVPCVPTQHTPQGWIVVPAACAEMTREAWEETTEDDDTAAARILMAVWDLGIAPMSPTFLAANTKPAPTVRLLLRPCATPPPPRIRRAYLAEVPRDSIEYDPETDSHRVWYESHPYTIIDQSTAYPDTFTAVHELSIRVSAAKWRAWLRGQAFGDPAAFGITPSDHELIAPHTDTLGYIPSHGAKLALSPPEASSPPPPPPSPRIIYGDNDFPVDITEVGTTTKPKPTGHTFTIGRAQLSPYSPTTTIRHDDKLYHPYTLDDGTRVAVFYRTHAPRAPAKRLYI